MVKAKLIENNSYFQLRKKQLTVLILASIPLLVVLNLHITSTWIWVSFGLYGLGLYVIGKNQKKISKVFGNRTIEMSDTEIRLTSQVQNQYECMILDGEEIIILDKDYLGEPVAISGAENDLFCNTFAHSITIRKGGFERKLEFELDSQYMTSQLKKVIEAWKSKGYQIVLPKKTTMTTTAI